MHIASQIDATERLKERNLPKPLQQVHVFTPVITFRYMYMCIHVYAYMYIYTHTCAQYVAIEREVERGMGVLQNCLVEASVCVFGTGVCVCVCVHVRVRVCSFI